MESTIPNSTIPNSGLHLVNIIMSTTQVSPGYSGPAIMKVQFGDE